MNYPIITTHNQGPSAPSYAQRKIKHTFVFYSTKLNYLCASANNKTITYADFIGKC